jgi:hypothetical protein
MLSTLLAEVHDLAPLVAPTWVFAAIAAAVFLVLGFVTFSFRDVANRHSDRTAHQNPDDHGHVSHGPSGAAH